MKREEMEKLIAGYERAAETNPAHTDLIIHVTAFSLRELIALARLGASVAAPSDREFEIVARSLCVTKLQNPNTLLDDPCGGQSPAWRFELLAAQNLLYDLRTRILKDRANV